MYTDQEKTEILQQLGFTANSDPTREHIASKVGELIDEAVANKAFNMNLAWVCGIVVFLILCLVIGCTPGPWESGAPGGNLIGK